MTMIEYDRGYGRRDPLPVCEPIGNTLECPCCKGAGLHTYGKGMDADSVDCIPCVGWGVFYLTTLSKPDKNKGEGNETISQGG